MRATTTDNGWALEGIGDLEWLFLERLPGTACGDELPADKKKRLLPAPVVSDGDLSAEDGEFIDDWDEYVRPELNLAFEEARRQVRHDLAAVTEQPASEAAEQSEENEREGDQAEDNEEAEDEAENEEGSSQALFRLEVAAGHSENWYSTLNQARLLMNEVYGLAESEASLYATIAGEEDDDSDGDGDAVPEPDGMQWLLLAQYQFYSFIQTFLLERVIRP